MSRSIQTELLTTITAGNHETYGVVVAWHATSMYCERCRRFYPPAKCPVILDGGQGCDAVVMPRNHQCRCGEWNEPAWITSAVTSWDDEDLESLREELVDAMESHLDNALELRKSEKLPTKSYGTGDGLDIELTPAQAAYILGAVSWDELDEEDSRGGKERTIARAFAAGISAYTLLDELQYWEDYDLDDDPLGAHSGSIAVYEDDEQLCVVDQNGKEVMDLR